MENTPLAQPAKQPQGIAGQLRAAHVGLRTTDYEGTIQWYTSKLGFRVLHKWTMGELKLALLAPANDDNFCLEVLSGGISGSSQDPSQPIISGFQHLCFAVENADEALAALRAQGVAVVQEPFDVPEIGQRCGFMADLHGNVLEFASPI
ncbi:MAG: VOC family protein [Hymenobacter sp.]|nr:MAG: VOC family protein [Hymenobacter sp.]